MTTQTELSFAVLKQRLRDQRDLFNQLHSTRLHRALSWLQAAENQSDDKDMQFISAWISFSACSFSSADTSGSAYSLAEQKDFQHFIQQLVELDKQQKIYHCLWHQYSGPVKALIKNPYVFAPFWQSLRENNEDWNAKFDRSSVDALNYLSRKKIPELLGIVLDRLQVLHNQVVGGGATYQSQINREQVEDGARLLMTLMPIIIDIMLESSDHDWGELAYPVIT
ncbi:MAG: hypothetical protein MK185_07920 [Saccharospirillaceae bacterium]|nr:hypothetical protein A3759_22970 [Thalassolituus sp. HI0120]KZZ45099.1 hypothetical protein A3759_10745 [Thalassolituus sp. HI0120]MCH2040545.1 hypothetical protein [Saccharospirillaceae bacterium]